MSDTNEKTPTPITLPANPTPPEPAQPDGMIAAFSVEPAGMIAAFSVEPAETTPDAEDKPED